MVSVVQEMHSSTDNSVKILKFSMEIADIAKLPSELQHYSNMGEKGVHGRFAWLMPHVGLTLGLMVPHSSNGFAFLSALCSLPICFCF